MYTKEQLKKQVENMGLTGEETILIHSSMKSIGEVEGGADPEASVSKQPFLPQ